jgi:quercetin dioxygenase-like cupin family protein
MTTLEPVVTQKRLDNTYRYAGGTITILLTGEDTGGQFSLWEAHQKPGGEPPLHLHLTDDETFLIQEGQVRFRVGDQILDATPGMVVFAPRGIPHTFRIKSPSAKMLTMVSPAGFEEWFQVLGTPAPNFDLPETVEATSPEEFPRMLALSRKLGTEILPGPVDL